MVMGALASPFEGPSAATSTLGNSKRRQHRLDLGLGAQLVDEGLARLARAAVLEELHDLAFDRLERRHLAARAALVWS